MLYAPRRPYFFISIHALREEGDQGGHGNMGMYGISIHALREEGDRGNHYKLAAYLIFLSTPSARRATHIHRRACVQLEFLSTPSARRATPGRRVCCPLDYISIHALREEGDIKTRSRPVCGSHFYPRPPRGGRLPAGGFGRGGTNFYPRPPRGGRHGIPTALAEAIVFLSTPSARRATG